MTTNDSKINQLLNNLDEWRHLPAYQLERRADIFFSLYLPEVLQKRFKLSEAPVLIPEFPVRYGSIPKSEHEKFVDKARDNQSFKIDYLATSKSHNQAYFVELKTDNSSISESQIDNMNRARKSGLRKLAEGVRLIHEVSNAGGKYKQLLRQTASLESWEINPHNVFILPETPPGTINEISEKFGTVISFHQFAEVVENHSDYLSLRFAKSLREWAKVGAGSKQ